MFLIACLALCAAPTTAQDRTAFFATWCTAKQCARAPIRSGGTVAAKPFEIGPDWLRHGWFWCRLSWGPMERRPEGLFTAAHAQCGEDSVRGYFLTLFLAGDELTLRWDFPHATGPLRRCPDG